MTLKKIFDQNTLAIEILEGIDLKGKIFLITGGSSGLGLESASCLAQKGARIMIVSSSDDSGQKAVSALKIASGNEQIEYHAIRFESLKDVNRGAHYLLEHLPKIDAIIGSAGIMATDFGLSDDGLERQFGINHMAHFLLITRLIPLLQKAGRARVVMMTSGAHRVSNVDLTDLNFVTRPYNRWDAYGQSKTANILFANGLDHRYGEKGIRALSIAPGVVAGTNLHNHLTEEDFAPLIIRQPGLKEFTPDKRKTVSNGASTIVFAAAHPNLEGCGGYYLEDCHVALSNADTLDHMGVMPYVRDMQTARLLWEKSEQILQSMDIEV